MFVCVSPIEGKRARASERNEEQKAALVSSRPWHRLHRLQAHSHTRVGVVVGVRGAQEWDSSGGGGGGARDERINASSLQVCVYA